MPQAKSDPFNELILDEEEIALEVALEKGEFEPSQDLEATKERLEEAARRNNIPYQTLLGAVLHDFAEDKNDIKVR